MKTITKWISGEDFKQKYGNMVPVRSYSGRKGCMCGCMGVYNDGAIACKRALSRMINHSLSDIGIDLDEDGSLKIAFRDTKTRRNVVYFYKD